MRPRSSLSPPDRPQSAGHAAIDPDDLAGDVARPVAAQEGGQRADVARPADAAGGDAPPPLVPVVAGEAVVTLDLDRSRRDGVDLDVVGGKLDRARLGEHVDAALA